MIVMRLIMQKTQTIKRLEVTDLNKIYIDKNQLECIKLDKNSIWLDSLAIYESSKNCFRDTKKK